MTELARSKCFPYSEDMLSFKGKVLEDNMSQLTYEWKLIDGKSIQREFTFEGFTHAIAFLNEVAEIAEAEGHHPDIHIFYNKVRIDLSTHAINGLSENDFIVAAKLDNRYP